MIASPTPSAKRTAINIQRAPRIRGGISAVESVNPHEITMMRRVLLTMIENLARDEARSNKRLRIPSNRELGRRIHEAEGNSRARLRNRA